MLAFTNLWKEVLCSAMRKNLACNILCPIRLPDLFLLLFLLFRKYGKLSKMVSSHYPNSSFYLFPAVCRYWRGSVSNVPCGIVDTGSGVWTTVSSYVSTLSAYLDLCTWSEMIDMRAQYCNILGLSVFVTFRLSTVVSVISILLA